MVVRNLQTQQQIYSKGSGCQLSTHESKMGSFSIIPRKFKNKILIVPLSKWCFKQGGVLEMMLTVLFGVENRLVISALKLHKKKV